MIIDHMGSLAHIRIRHAYYNPNFLHEQLANEQQCQVNNFSFIRQTNHARHDFEGLDALLIIIWFTINFSYSAWVSLNVHICKVIPLVSIELSFLFKAGVPKANSCLLFLSQGQIMLGTWRKRLHSLKLDWPPQLKQFSLLISCLSLS